MLKKKISYKPSFSGKCSLKILKKCNSKCDTITYEMNPYAKTG